MQRKVSQRTSDPFRRTVHLGQLRGVAERLAGFTSVQAPIRRSSTRSRRCSEGQVATTPQTVSSRTSAQAAEHPNRVERRLRDCSWFNISNRYAGAPRVDVGVASAHHTDIPYAGAQARATAMLSMMPCRLLRLA